MHQLSKEHTIFQQPSQKLSLRIQEKGKLLDKTKNKFKRQTRNANQKEGKSQKGIARKTKQNK